MISKKVKDMDVSGVRKMFEMASQMENPIDLSLGLPDFDVPQSIKEEAINAINQGKNKYTPTKGIEELKKAVISKLKKENNIEVTANEIIITSAASGALSIILATIIDPDDEIILFDPYFVSYKQLILQNNGKPVYVKTKDDFSFDLEDLKSKITNKAKAILINYPNNPTGKIYSEEQLKELAEIARKNNLLIISDEIYEKFSYDQPHFSIGSIYENTITINGFSKSHSMTGWRVGYCVGPSEIIAEAVKPQQFNFVCSPTPFQYAAVKALDVDMQEQIDLYKEKRDLIYEGLKNNYEIVKPDGAFYAFIKYPYDSEKFLENCIKNNLLVVPGNVFSEENNYFRISFATKNEILKKAVEVLNKVAKE